MPGPFSTYRHMQSRFARPAWLFIAFALGSVPCVAQAVTVSMKIHLGTTSPTHRDPVNPMGPRPSGEVVAWLSPVDSSTPMPPRAVPSQGYRLLQKNKEFAPHLLVVPTGTSIDFPNEDPFFHNVFSLFNGKRFDLGLYEAGSHRTVRFDREGISYIFCNIHPEMGAVVVSLRTPYYAVSSRDGSVSIANVPPGEYTLKLWEEGVSQDDLAQAGRSLSVGKENIALGTITLVRSADATEHKNKFGEDYKPDTTKPY